MSRGNENQGAPGVEGAAGWVWEAQGNPRPSQIIASEQKKGTWILAGVLRGATHPSHSQSRLQTGAGIWGPTAALSASAMHHPRYVSQVGHRRIQPVRHHRLQAGLSVAVLESGKGGVGVSGAQRPTQTAHVFTVSPPENDQRHIDHGWHPFAFSSSKAAFGAGSANSSRNPSPRHSIQFLSSINAAAVPTMYVPKRNASAPSFRRQPSQTAPLPAPLTHMLAPPPPAEPAR